MAPDGEIAAAPCRVLILNERDPLHPRAGLPANRVIVRGRKA